MVDLSPFKKKIEKGRATAIIEYDDPRAAFLCELAAAGFTPPKVLLIGKLERIDDPDDKRGAGTGWYVYHEMTKDDGKVLASATYGSWRGNPERVDWSSKSAHGLSVSERLEYDRHREAARVLRDEEKKKLQAEAASKCFEIWQSSPPAQSSHPYLKRKQIMAHEGVRISRGNIILPITVDEQITSLQFIEPDGTKKFKKHGRWQGCYFKIEGTAEGAGNVYVVEGYSTGASVWLATHDDVYVAFNAGNLYEVTALVKKLHQGQRIVIIGDDDVTTTTNAGRTKALQAAEGLGVECVFFVDADGNPVNDANDLHVNEGIEALKAALEYKPPVYKEKKKKVIHSPEIYRPSGILGEIVNYYHATSGNKQIGFAVQAAIAVCSVICSRNFTTNYSNRTSLFMLNVGISGTGKEHVKNVIEKILEATENGHLVSGDGYTSGAAVISALQERPRHLTVIDEFSKYLQAANNKYGSSHLMEANTQLMQAIGRLDGTMRPRAYATIGATKERKKDLANQFVVNPAITMVGMTTPDDFFNNIDLRAIKDGFLNRFIICLSDAQRSIREHKEPIAVPQSIIEWAEVIRLRHGGLQDMPTEPPSVVTLTFSQAALDKQHEFQLHLIDIANELQKYQMDDIVGRSNEMAMRLALIVALSRDPFAEIIDADDMEWSITWVKTNLTALVDKLKMSVSSSEHEGYKKELLQALRDRPDGVTWSQMQKQAPFSKHKAKDLAEMLKALLDAELAFSEPFNSGGKGRPTILWRAAE